MENIDFEQKKYLIENLEVDIRSVVVEITEIVKYAKDAFQFRTKYKGRCFLQVDVGHNEMCSFYVSDDEGNVISEWFYAEHYGRVFPGRRQMRDCELFKKIATTEFCKMILHRCGFKVDK